MSDSHDESRSASDPHGGLLEALEAMMPELHPRLDWSERKIFQEVGQRDYLKMLRVVP